MPIMSTANDQQTPPPSTQSMYAGKAALLRPITFAASQAAMIEQQQQQPMYTAGYRQFHQAAAYSMPPDVTLYIANLHERVTRLEELIYSDERVSGRKDGRKEASVMTPIELREHLDRLCTPQLQLSPNPSTRELNIIVDELASYHCGIERPSLLSSARKWFRKRREYMTSRINASCEKVFYEDRIVSEEALKNVIARIDAEPELVERVRELSALDLARNEAADKFLREKMAGYLKAQYDKTHLSVVLSDAAASRKS